MRPLPSAPSAACGPSEERLPSVWTAAPALSQHSCGAHPCGADSKEGKKPGKTSKARSTEGSPADGSVAGGAPAQAGAEAEEEGEGEAEARQAVSDAAAEQQAAA